MPPGPESPGTRRAVARRRVLVGALTGAGLLGVGLAAPRLSEQLTRLRGEDPVRSSTVAFTSARERSALSPAAARDLPPHTRVLPGPRTAAAADREQVFLAATADWLAEVPARHRDLARSALLDLWVLGDGLPATAASWAGAWRFVWPRDTAFVAAALARIGLPDLAWAQMRHLQSLQGADGWFAARYEVTGAGVPDDRPAQLDSVGLVLWALAEVLDSASTAPTGRPSADPSAALSDLRPLLDRSTSLLLDLTAEGTALPPVSPDYWEVGEARVTLGIAAPTLIGLESLSRIGEGGPATVRLGGPGIVTEAAGAFTDTFTRTFVAGGLQRYPSSGGVDSALAYLSVARSAAALLDVAALDRVRERLRQPAGGIKPGHGWIVDDTSWTPSTSLLALGYARLGAAAQSEEILDWLAAHRTEAGSLPEKVDGRGRPVSVAPLAWTAANVVLALDGLRSRHGAHGP